MTKGVGIRMARLGQYLKLFLRTEALYQRISRFQILQMLQTIQTKGTVSPEERFSVLDVNKEVQTCAYPMYYDQTRASLPRSNAQIGNQHLAKV